MLISDKHKERYIEYYSTRPQTPRQHKWQEQVEEIAAKIGANSILDYGAGVTQSLSKFSSLPVTDYDPVLPGMNNPHALRPFDMVVCNHVLEHVEPECLDEILQHIKRLTVKLAYVAVSCELSTKKLPDGTEWHLIVHEPAWWRHKFAEHFPGFEEVPAFDRNKEIRIVWER